MSAPDDRRGRGARAGAAASAASRKTWLVRHRQFVRGWPHWGQREVLEAYYKMRGNENEPIVAYQMNWKGENFYTGNKIPAFVSSGATFTNWIKSQQEKGIKTFWFVTEHSRTSEVNAY